jgi:hypothetical protein
MDTQNVLTKLKLLRPLSEEEAAACLPMIQAAAQRLEGQQTALGGDSLLESAAAALVNWQMALTEPEEDFTAGDVRFSGRNGAENARKIWLDAKNAAAPYLHDEAFVFRSIP